MYLVIIQYAAALKKLYFDNMERRKLELRNHRLDDLRETDENELILKLAVNTLYVHKKKV